MNNFHELFIKSLKPLLFDRTLRKGKSIEENGAGETEARGVNFLLTALEGFI